MGIYVILIPNVSSFCFQLNARSEQSVCLCKYTAYISTDATLINRTLYVWLWILIQLVCSTGSEVVLAYLGLQTRKCVSRSPDNLLSHRGLGINLGLWWRYDVIEHSNLRIQNQSHGSGVLTTATVSFYVAVLCNFRRIINRDITVVPCIT